VVLLPEKGGKGGKHSAVKESKSVSMP